MSSKAGHSMIRRAPSTHPPEGPPARTALMNRHEARWQQPRHPHKPPDRTSKPAPQASEPHRSRSAYSERPRRPTCRLLDGRKPPDRTTDASDTTVRDSRSRGCYQAALYNTIRPYSGLGNLTPAAYAKISDPGMQRNGTLRYPEGSAPRPVAPPSQQGSNEARILLIPG